MDVISKIDNTWFQLGIFRAVERVQVEVDGLNDQNWMVKLKVELEIFVMRTVHFVKNGKSIQLNYCLFLRPSTFNPFDQTFFQKMDLGSSVSHFPGPICYQRVGVRTSSHRVNGQSDVGCQDGVVVEVSSQRKLFKNWSILVNLVSSRFPKKMFGSLVLQDCVLVIPMKRW